MFTNDQYQSEISGLVVQDAVVAMQLIRRFVKSGQLEDIELFPMALLRGKLVSAVQAATGVNYDDPKTQVATVTTPAPEAAAVAVS
jgi:hypothetical protein